MFDNNTILGFYFSGGSFFLALTLIIYMRNSELRNVLNSYYLMCHIACLFICYSTLSVILLFYTWIRKEICIAAAHLIVFTFAAAVFWLNVLCIDISVILGYDNKKAEKVFNFVDDKILFLSCCIYVFGVSSIISALILYQNISKNVYNVSNESVEYIYVCWFFDDETLFIYLYLPVGGIILVNYLLFAFTITMMVRKFISTHKMFNNENMKYIGKTKYNSNNCLVSCVKLFALTGITGTLELILLITGKLNSFHYFANASNSLRGFIIFIYVGLLREKYILWLMEQIMKDQKNDRNNESRKNSEKECSIQTI